MFIVVEHTITNPDVFFGLAAKSRRSTFGNQGTPVFPEREQRSGGLSLGSQFDRRFEGLLGTLDAQSSRNTYYTVDSTKAMGLPTR